MAEDYDQIVAESSFPLSGSGGPYAPVLLTDRFKGLGVTPRDKDPLAVPQSSQPSMAVAEATSNAIEKMALSGEKQRFEAGTYWLARSYSPSGGSADKALKGRAVHFENTTLRAHPSAPLTNFHEHIGEGGGAHLEDEEKTGNLPIPENVHCLVDLTNTRGSHYGGRLFLDGANKDKLCLIGASNHLRLTVESGGGSSVWDCYIELSKSKYGLFGCPRYGSERKFYHDTFVGNVFSRIKVNDTVLIPMLVASNTFDDAWISTFGVVSKTAKQGDYVGGSYMFGTEVCVGNIFSMGAPGMYCFDAQKSLFTFQKLYCEERSDAGGPQAAVVARNDAWIEGVLKYGSTSKLQLKAMIHAVGDTGGGRVSNSHNNDIGDMTAVVALDGRTKGARRWHVESMYPDADLPPYRMIGTQTSQGDQLTSGSPTAALTRWKQGASGLIKQLPQWN